MTEAMTKPKDAKSEQYKVRRKLLLDLNQQHYEQVEPAMLRVSLCNTLH